MIPYRLHDEKETLLFYSQRLNDDMSRRIIEHGRVRNQHEARQLAEFFGRALAASARSVKDRAGEVAHRYVFQTLTTTLTACFHLAGYPSVWEDVTGKN